MSSISAIMYGQRKQAEDQKKEGHKTNGSDRIIRIHDK